jgi:hypothetical protein
MRLPRFRLRTLLIAVIVVAALLGWLARPYPTNVRLGGGPSQITWSNGEVSELAPNGALPSKCRHRGPLIAVDWDDGTATWHLKVPYKGEWGWWWHTIDPAHPEPQTGL